MNNASANNISENNKKSQALLRFALGNHNAKRYNEAAGFYEYIIKLYPDTEAARFSQTNLNDLTKKVEIIEPIKPDSTLISRIEQSVLSESSIKQDISPPSNHTTENTPQSNQFFNSNERLPRPNNRLRITENPYILAGLFILTAAVSYFIGREHVKYEIRQVFTGAADQFKKNISEAMSPLKNLNTSSQEKTIKEKNSETKLNTFKLPVKIESKEFTKIGYRDVIVFRINIDNTLNKPIKAFEGSVIFKDLLGKLILGAKISYRDGIAAHGNAVWEGEIGYNQFVDRHRELANININQLLPELEIYKIAYEDGTIEEFPEP